MVERLLYKVADAAEALNISKVTLYGLLKEGIIGHVRKQSVKGPTKILIPKEEIEKYVKSGLTYGYKTALPEGVLEKKRDQMAKARVFRHKKKEKRDRRKAGADIYENTENTIYALKLKPRTFDILWKNDLIQLHEVNLFDPDVAKKLVTLKGFGVMSYKDLESALARYNMDRVEHDKKA